MRLTSYFHETGLRVLGLRDNGQGDFERIDLHETNPRIPPSIKMLLAMGSEGLQLAKKAIAEGQPLSPEGIRLAPPLPRPEKIICLGKNYADHAKEMGGEPPTEPVIFNKFPSALACDGQPIILPSSSSQVDYEAELVVVIGRGGHKISREEAMRHVAGYCCGNDISARDWQFQKPSGQWLLGKTFDTFAPIGPAIVTADEIPSPGELGIRLRLNGEVMQESNTANLIFPIDFLISYVSQVCTLAPGDLIFTGTPPGVGFARKPPVFLKPGDIVEVEIDRIGKLTNPLVAEDN